MRNVAVLGSTGSIGTQTLDIVRNNSSILQVGALAAKSNVDLLEKQIREFKPEIACMWDEKKAQELKVRVADTDTRILSGMNGLIEVATYSTVDIVLVAVVGMIGIRPVIEAIKAHKNIALANKETLVTAGHIIMDLVKEYNVKLYPVDSEHSAIFQSLNGEEGNPISKILLTASGGPFRGMSATSMEFCTVEDALKHPNWSMGKKITIDSATMVNKGLEVIEAKWLFNVPVENIQVVIQPQSLIHSMVEYEDGAIIAQLGTPDMKIPIQYALFYPKRMKLSTKKVDFFDIQSISFEKPDLGNFKGLALGIKAGQAGGSLPTVYNAANELAVSKFLDKKIGFMDIPKIIEYTMEKHSNITNPSVEQILETEQWTYEMIKDRW